MDVALSAEQQMLAQTAADIAEDIAAGWNSGKGPRPTRARHRPREHGGRSQQPGC